MRVSAFFTSVFTPLISAVISVQSMAAEFKTEVVDLRPVFPLRLNIDVTGAILPGDSSKLQAIINRHAMPEMRDISITFDSPGGSLYEGMRMANILREAAPIVSADVGRDNSILAECASACAVAYMGADLRYLRAGSRIGVHQFSDATGSLDADSAMNVAQRVSSEIVSLMQAQRIDHAFFDRMSNTEAHDIDWVSHEDLIAWRVVNNGVFDERMEKFESQLMQMGLRPDTGNSIHTELGMT